MIKNLTHLDLEHKKELFIQHQRNLNYLEQQAAKYGADLPLAVYNTLTVERDIVAKLERELAVSGALPEPAPTWHAMVIEPDPHWREITVRHLQQLEGKAIVLDKVPTEAQQELIDRCAVAIVSSSCYTEATKAQWIESMVKLARHLPIILLVGWEDKALAVALRQAFHNDGQSIGTTTIFKQTFDFYWFSRIIHEILVR